MDLFADVGAPATPAPLTERMRPRTLHEFRGQRQLLEPGGAWQQMLAGGSDPDAGLYAEPRALALTVAATQAVAPSACPRPSWRWRNAVLFLATAPKSHRVTVAYEAARADVRELGRGEGYLVPHDFAHGIVAQDYWPQGFEPRSDYEPSDAGEEPQVAARLQGWQELRAELRERGLPGEPAT